jgi:hypothetical protein
MDMRRNVVLVTFAVLAQVVAVWWNEAFQGISLLTDPAEPIGVALTITVTAAIAGVLAWRAFVPRPASPAIGIVFVAIGAVMTFGWPLGFAAATSWATDVAHWGAGAALPQWQGALTAVIGAGLVLRAVLTPPGSPRDIAER